MSENNRSSLLVLGILTIIGLAFSLYLAFSNMDMESLIPLFQVPGPYYFLLVVLVIPMVGSILTGLLLPRIIVPLYMSFKKIVMGGYKDAYVDINQNRLSLRRWFGRAFLTAFLILGLISAVINSADPQLFMTSEQYTEFLSEAGTALMTPPVIMGLAGLIAPIAFGLLAASWLLEDAGLLQYNLPEIDEAHLYEVEPTYLRYKGYLKGYAGVSSFLFLASVFLVFWNTGGVRYEDMLFTLLIPMFFMLQTIPGYLVYSKLGVNYLRKGLPTVGKLTEADLKLS